MGYSCVCGEETVCAVAFMSVFSPVGMRADSSERDKTNLDGPSDVLRGNRRTFRSGAVFDNGHHTQTRIEKANSFVNNASKTNCFYSDTDALDPFPDGGARYTSSFHGDRLPSEKDARSLTLYNWHYFSSLNAHNRYAPRQAHQKLEFRRKRLALAPRARREAREDSFANASLVPAVAKFSLYLRVNRSLQAILDEYWTPPSIACEGRLRANSRSTQGRRTVALARVRLGDADGADAVRLE
jgi:hypothetical protein